MFKIGVILFSLLFLSCDQDDEASKFIETGTYIGSFTVVYGSEKKSGTTMLKLENGKYTSSGNPDRIPAGGSGSYSIKDNKIIFSDENFWTADFDGNLILSGEYTYTFNGKKLKISANKNDVGYYEYDLSKQ